MQIVREHRKISYYLFRKNINLSNETRGLYYWRRNDAGAAQPVWRNRLEHRYQVLFLIRPKNLPLCFFSSMR